MSLVPTAASKKMMLSQIASKQAENGERAGSPDVLRCSQVRHSSPCGAWGSGGPSCLPGGTKLRLLRVLFVLLFREVGSRDPLGENERGCLWN